MKRIVALMVISLSAGIIAGCPSREAKREPGELVGQLPDAPPPGPASREAAAPGTVDPPTAPTGTSATGAGPQAEPGPATSKPAIKPMAEEKFIAISAKLVLASKTVADNETGRKQLEDYTARVLQENGVTAEEFQAYTNALTHNEARRREVTDRILARAREYAAPEVRAKLKVASPRRPLGTGQ